MAQTMRVQEPRRSQVPEDRPARLAPLGEKTSAPESLVKLECYECRRPFLMDLEEAWSIALHEAEMLGRQFVGIPLDAPLCPRCLDHAEQAGAERMYWRVALS